MPSTVLPAAWDLDNHVNTISTMATNPFGTTIPRGATSFYDFSQNDDGQQPGVTSTQDDGENGTPAPPSLATPTLNGNSGSSSSTSTTTTTVTSPYAQFKGNNYEELEEFLRGQMESIKPDTKDEREKREKREKRVGFLARLADGLGAFHTAFSHARGIKAMDMPKMSAKARELFEKAKAQRDKDNDRLVNYAITLGNIKDRDRDFNFRVAQAEQQQGNWREQFDAGRKDRADDVSFRDKKFDTDKEQWQKGFDENQRQFDVTAKEHERHNRASEGLQGASIAEQRRHNKASEGLERQRVAASQDGRYTEFYSGSGMIKIPNTRLNQHNISYVFSKTPAAGRPAGGYDMRTGQASPVSADQMMDWIGSNIDDPNVQGALRAIGGVTNTNDNTPPSRRNNKSNTPPSRR